mmetsp:Transcript_8595/g.38316  ORF Transcript_8595/g.38316 Transcript_8595/m.38316 type:complete len:86 (-) Transcript_8595:735-992(-)
MTQEEGEEKRPDSMAPGSAFDRRNENPSSTSASPKSTDLEITSDVLLHSPRNLVMNHLAHEFCGCILTLKVVVKPAGVLSSIDLE